MEHIAKIDFEYYNSFIKRRQVKEPLCMNLEDQLKETANEIYIFENSDEEKELLNILQHSIFIKTLSWAYDRIAQKDYEPQLNHIPYEVDEDEISLKICTLYKSTYEPLGATIRRENSKSKNIVIARVMNGGSIDRSKMVKNGDRLLAVNDICTTDMDPEDVIPLLTPSNGVIKMVIEQANDLSSDDTCLIKKSSLCSNEIKNDKIEIVNNQSDIFYARVLFNYNPINDKTHPCREAGLHLHAGDIIEICNWSEEQDWWQGRLLSVSSINNSASLNAIVNVLNNLDNSNNLANIASIIPGKNYHKNTINSDNDEINSNEIDFNEKNIISIPAIYEELCIFDPIYQYPRKRPIAVFFSLDDKILLSLKYTANSNISDLFIENGYNRTQSFGKNINTIIKYILTEMQLNEANNLFKFPTLYKTTASITALIKNKNETKSSNNQTTLITKLIENSNNVVLNKDEWNYEQENLLNTVFDDEHYSYKLDELWQTFLEDNQQQIIFPSFNCFKYLRNVTQFGKMCFYILINLQDISNLNTIERNDNINYSPKLNLFNQQQTLNKIKHNSILTSKKYNIEDIKHLFDIYFDTSNHDINEILVKLKESIMDINQIPTFVIK